MIDLLEFRRRFPTVATLPQAALVSFASALEEHEYKNQAVIFAAGDPSDAVYLLARGAVLVLHSGVEGPQVPLERIREGEMVGEMGLVDGGHRSASVVVEEAVLAWRLSRQDYLQLRDEGHPAIAWILQELGERVSHRVRAVQSRISRARSQPSLASSYPIEPARRRRRWYQWLLPWI